MIDAATLAANLDNPQKRVGYIYTISNIETGKVYVGSSVNTTRRFYLHRRDLVSGVHHSPILQNAWNKYGVDAFVFEVVETVQDINFLVAREQFWIWRNEALLMNCSMNAGSPLGVKRSAAQKAAQSERMRKFFETPSGIAVANLIHSKTRGRKQGIEERAMRSAALKGKKCGREWTKEQRDAHSLALKGRKMPPVSDATKRNISLAQKGVRRSPEAVQASIAAARERNKAWIDAEKPYWLSLIDQGLSFREIERVTGRSRDVVARECRS